MKTKALPIRTWNTGGSAIRYTTMSMKYKDVKKYFKPRIFEMTTGTGEQRQNAISHVNRLAGDMVDGLYSPDTWHSAVPDELFGSQVEMDDDKNTVTIDLKEDSPLPLVNGFHRESALAKLAKGENTGIGIDDQPIELLIYLDGEPKQHFLNLQKAKAVDKSHLMSLSRNIPETMSDVVKTAYDLAKLLNENQDSPFYHQVRFVAGKLLMPVNTICSHSSGELICSLVGTAKLAESLGKTKEEACEAFCKWWKYLSSEYNTAFSEGKLLAPPHKNGSKGSATLIVGLINLLIWYDWNESDEQEIQDAIENSLVLLNEKVNHNLSAPHKRLHMQHFAVKLFENYLEKKRGELEAAGELEKFDKVHWFNVPRSIVTTLSCGCFALRAIKKGE